MLIPYLIIVFVAVLSAELLRMVKFKGYLLAGFLIFLILSAGLALAVKLNVMNEPFNSAEYLTSPDLRH
jgi:4-amino-4-deoxy-L-arabinose transferase-like glycosyltransferase